ncbi:MAG: pseudouridine synthase [Tissierellia bacterium]|nr:pseudouridine synthase [Tissierellia bacterium]
MRLQVYLAHAGVASRRASEEIIAAGRVKVNGEVVSEMGRQVLITDKITVDGKRIRLKERNTYLLLNKPRNVISTVKDERNRKTVMDFIDQKKYPRLYPVGRLDRDSSGLILLTDDGDLTQKLLHPSTHVPKTYRLTVQGRVTEEEVQALSAGIHLDDGPTAPAEFKILEYRGEKTRLEAKIYEGRNRQLRRMMESLEKPVLELERVAFGPIELKGLGKGQVRPLSKKEVALLKKAP